MGARISLRGLLAITLNLMLAAAPQPPVFSPGYGEALRDVLKLEESDVALLERRLAMNPDDSTARLKLMAYYLRADRASRPEDCEKRVRHALWLIEFHPDSEILHSYVSRFSPVELPEADYRRAVALWSAATRAQPASAAIQWNAASFFEGLNTDIHVRYMETTVAADPNHPVALRGLAHFYALSVLKGGPEGARSLAALESTKNVWILGNAAYMLQSQYNRSLQRGAPNRRAAELAERYFLRAQAIDPNLDRRAILPQLDPRESRPDRPVQAAPTTGTIRRLSVDAFPTLPPAVAGVLRARNCTVPQPFSHGPARNVIRGEFFAKGQIGWAVLCSVNDSTTLLAFRSDRDTNPHTLVTSEDRASLQGLGNDTVGYSREITAVSRDFIMGHYRAYGGPEPPPIDHQGVDDAFLGKASTTWYFHQGKWLQLQGAD